MGLIDRHLSEGLTHMMSQVRDDVWEPIDEMIPGDPKKSELLYDKNAGELYGVLCSITGGEAKSLVRGIRDDQGQTKQDGFRALLELGKRFDSQNSATRLQAFLEVCPRKLQNWQRWSFS